MIRENRLLKTTTANIQERVIERYIRVLSAEVVIRHPSIGRMDDFESMPGRGRQEDVEDLIRQGRKDASSRLERKAQAVKADGIVDIQYQYSTIGKSSVLVVATGTAVELR